MIIESLGDHEDEVAKRAKQAAENSIKKRLTVIKYPTVEKPFHVPLSQKEPLIKKLLNKQNCSMKRWRPLISTKSIIIMSENNQLPKKPHKCCRSKPLRKRLVNLTRHSMRKVVETKK